MNCQEILTTLAAYRSKVSDVLSVNPSSIEITSQYSFIAVSINNNEIHIEFEISENASTINQLYCSDKSIEDNTRKHLDAVNWPGLESGSGIPNWSKDVLDHIQTADDIARLTVNCAAGDNYRPGNFSKVILSKDYIELQQVNHMNAKSLDHKNNYSLRSLVFRIPLNVVGEMQVTFSDNSSENNKPCGSKIEAELKKLSLTS